MEISDVFSAGATHGLGISAKLLLPRLCLPLSLSALYSSAPSIAVRSDPFRAGPAPSALARRIRRRTRRRFLTEGSGDDDDDAFSGDGDGDDGPFGGGGDAGGSGKGWNSGDSGHGWDGSFWSSSSDPAFDFIYMVMCWIALSNCAHFAFKKMGRVLTARGPQCADF